MSNTPESPITVTVDHDPRGVSVGVWQGSHCIYSGAHPLPAAPASPVSTVEKGDAVRRLRDAIEGECSGVWISEKQAVAVLAHLGRCAPAAGDAQAVAAPEWATCESRGPWARNSLKAVIDLLRGKETRARHAFTKDYMGLPARYIADAYGEAAAVVERKLEAIAAQRQGDA